MTALFDYRDDSNAPLLVRLDTLPATFGIEPAHVIADRDSPMVIAIGPARYLSRKDLSWFLHKRAEEALARRRSGTEPVPLCAELADAVCNATSGPHQAAELEPITA